MRFTKTGDIYKVIRITGAQDNILGISFASAEANIDVVEWDTRPGAKLKSSPNQVQEQVISGLKEINSVLGKSYFLSKIYFLPSDSASNSVYEFLTQELIKRLDNGEDFVEV